MNQLRTQALASLHSGLQINQGIPISHVTKWLGMEVLFILSLQFAFLSFLDANP